MSTYGHDMEREFSTQSLSTRAGSEMESHYTTEGGLYMSSFAATALISGIVTAGVSLLSLLVSLIIMLRSCQNGKSHIIEMHRYNHNFEYCKNLALHAELNGLCTDSFPTFCEDVATQYIEEGQYMRDLNITVSIAEDFFHGIKPVDSAKDVVLMDADDFVALETLDANLSTHMISSVLHGSSKYAKYLKHIFVKKLFNKLQSDGWSIILLSRKSEKLGNVISQSLISMGCPSWSSLLMRMENETQMDSQEFLSSKRTAIQSHGSRIKAVISSQMDALTGPCLGERVFKIPNPILSYNVDCTEKMKLEDQIF